MKSKLIVILSFAVTLISAQTLNLLNVKSPEKFAKKHQAYLDSIQSDPEQKPLEYGYVSDKDIMWSKITWEIIDMNELINQPLYHSTPGIAGVAQQSFFDVIKEALDKGKIKEAYADESFSTKTDYAASLSKFKIRDTSDWARQQLAMGKKLEEGDIDVWEMRNSDVKMMKIMGMWYVDKKLGELRYRPLGIAFLGPDMKAIKADIEDDRYYDLFWVWYADARDVLSKHKVFSGRNSSADISFDDIINARRFSSVIYKVQNMQGRSFEEIAPGDAELQLEFSENVRNEIRDVEQGLWNR